MSDGSSGVSPINNPAPSSEVRYPRIRIVADGKPVMGILEARVTTNNYLGADTWSARLVSGPAPERDARWWADQADIPLEVQLGFASDATYASPVSWTTMIVGRTDGVSINWLTGEIDVHGRDLTSRLIDARVQESNPNLTYSQLAEKYAAEAGLTAEVTATTTLVGQRYDHQGTGTALSEFSRSTTKWDALVYLAQKEGHDIWVSGYTFHSRPHQEPDRQHPFLVRFIPGILTAGAPGSASRTAPVFTALTLDTDRHHGLAKDVEVLVQSHDPRTGRTYRAVRRGSAGSASGGRSGRRRGSTLDPNDPLSIIPRAADSGEEDPLAIIPGYQTGARRGRQSATTAPPAARAGVSRYTYMVPGLRSDDEAIRFAEAKLKELTEHERLISCRMPGDLVLAPRHMIQLEGTGSSFDQQYYVDKIERSVSPEGGFTQTVSAKNTSPRETVDLSSDPSESSGSAVPLTSGGTAESPGDGSSDSDSAE
ncbi:conserved protein of unknown function (plasmid) [Rhodovastum atsumiense]|uniref:Phage late control D family protein n=1 Tax=Rhodovastum atsumiense TaxID=504468 RepID=A0A5M6IUD3_9PROT|nr:hypothetical protein [Rhodovastum atsumiense]KAA5611882.1 hypothetical protein F1189_12685 [Rhodovastum atsumiense]CAH2606139.1 conserved protein of unknown function [Rhodovastum atsumiense]